MFTKGKSLKRSPYKAFLYPYILIIVFFCLLFITGLTRQSQLIHINSNNTIQFYLNRNAQQEFRTIVESHLSEHSMASFQNWINSCPVLYGDLNGDGLSDSLFLITYLGTNGQLIEFTVCHYLLKPSEWGIKQHPVATIPLEVNTNKTIQVLPNRYCIPPRIGLLYQINGGELTVVSIIKISILHAIE